MMTLWYSRALQCSHRDGDTAYIHCVCRLLYGTARERERNSNEAQSRRGRGSIHSVFGERVIKIIINERVSVWSDTERVLWDPSLGSEPATN